MKISEIKDVLNKFKECNFNFCPDTETECQECDNFVDGETFEKAFNYILFIINQLPEDLEVEEECE